jgi:hypothetical protein
MSIQFVGVNGADPVKPGQAYRATFEASLVDRLTPGQGLQTTYNRISSQTPSHVISEPPVDGDKVAVIDIKADQQTAGLTVSQLANALENVSSYTTLTRLEILKAAAKDLGTQTRGPSREAARTTAAAAADAGDPLKKFVNTIKTAGTVVVGVALVAGAVAVYVLAKRAGLLKRGGE